MSQLEVYYCPPEAINKITGRAILTGDEAHHLSRVRRCNAREEVWLIDGIGNAWKSTVQSATKTTVELNLHEQLSDWNEPAVYVHAGIGILKGDHLFAAIDMAVQLGVSEITPLTSQYSITKWNQSKTERSQRIALKAVKQCGRSRIPTINNASNIENWIEVIKMYPDKYVFSQDTDETSILQNESKIAIAVGPEGGFSPVEENRFSEAGFKGISLGNRRLRTEVAVAAAIALLKL